MQSMFVDRFERDTYMVLRSPHMDGEAMQKGLTTMGGAKTQPPKKRRMSRR